MNVAKWNERGDLLISGSDDRELNVWRYVYGGTPRLLHTVRTGHTNNIFTAHTLPLDENQTVSGGMDHQVRMCNIERGTHELLFAANALISKVHFVPWQRQVFYTCAYDGFVRLSDLRMSPRGRTSVLFSMRSVGCNDASASAIAFDPIDARQFVLAGGDHRLRVFDLRAVDRVEHAFDLSSDADLVSDHPSMVSVVASGVDWSASGLIAATYSGRPAILYDVRRGRVRTLLAAQPAHNNASASHSDDESNGVAAAASLDETLGTNPRVLAPKLVRSEGNTPLTSVRDEDFDESNEIDEDDLDDVEESITIGGVERRGLDEDDSDGDDDDNDDAAAAPVVPTLQPVRARLIGHDNRQTFLKEIAFFNDDYVVTGSDCGNVFVWDVGTTDGVPLNVVSADDTVVNGIAPHPYLPVLATCGIDSTVKILSGGATVTADVAAVRERVDENHNGIERARQMEERFFRFYASGLFELLQRGGRGGDDDTSD